MSIREEVLKCIENILKEEQQECVISEEITISRENGFTSLVLVSLVLEIEEALDTDLDEYLSKIRKCKTVGELIDVVEIAKSNS